MEVNEFKDDHPIIEQILDNYGYRWKTWVRISIFFVITLSDGVVMTYLSNVIIPFEKFFSLSNMATQFVSAALFLGVGLGSASAGFISSFFLRHTTIRVCYFILLVMFILMSWSTNIVLFGILRFLVGFFNGVLIPVGQNLLAEYLPIRHRSLILTSIWLGFGVGTILFICCQFILMPNLEASQLNYTIALSAVIFVVIYVYVFFVVDDSPRHYIIKEEPDKAFKILEDMHGGVLTDNTKALIIDQVRNSVTLEKAQFSEVFSPKFLRTTIILSFVWAILSIINYGPSVISSLTIAQLGVQTKMTNNEVLINMLILTVCNLPGSILGGVLSDVPILGRKMSMITGYSVGILFILLACWVSSQFSIFLGIALSFFGIPFNIIGTYSSEIYPTKIRDMAVGYMYFCTRMGGIISQFAYLGMNSVSVFLPYYVSAGLAGVAIILVIFLPFETHGTPLDHDHAQEIQLKSADEENINLLKKEE